MNGGWGACFQSRDSTEATEYSAPARRSTSPRAAASSRRATLPAAAAVSWPVLGSKSFPVASRLPSRLVRSAPKVTPLAANVPSRSQ